MEACRLAYLAGVLDGEGHITVLRSKNAACANGIQYRPYINITNTSKALMDWILENFGGSVKTVTKRDGNRKPVSYWYMTGRNAASLIGQVLPYLVVKHRQAVLLLEFYAVKSKGSWLDDGELCRREALVNDLKSLNKRGVA